MSWANFTFVAGYALVIFSIVVCKGINRFLKIMLILNISALCVSAYFLGLNGAQKPLVPTGHSVRIIQA